MKSKLEDVFKELSYEELKELEKDINSGGNKLKEALWRCMRELSNSEKFCIVCFSKLNGNKIEINHKSKRLNFCAMDCMQSFLSYIKEVKESEK